MQDVNDMMKKLSKEQMEQIGKRSLEQSQIKPEEFKAMSRAANKFFSHLVIGASFGAIVGVGLPYRQAWLRTMRQRAREQAGHVGASAKAGNGAPNVFYPKLSAGATGAGAEGAAQEGASATKRGMPLIAQGVLGGLFGAYIGGFIGSMTGRRASNQLLEAEAPGVTEKFKSLGANIVEQMRQAEAQGKMSPGVSRENDESGDAMRREWDESSTKSEGVDGATAPTPAPTSRWDELRRQKAAPPSTWDTIRESSARASLPSSPSKTNSDENSFTPRDDQDLKTSSHSHDEMESSQDREARRKAFEELVERERRGGQEETKRWR
ncbi:hypothetical protein T439DRAFT_325690 [Meredithblackwellia eburnea MCA 4105]